MSAAEVIESVDVFEEGNFDLPAGLPVFAPNHFRLKGFEKALDSSVVVAISLSTHGRGQAVVPHNFLVVMGTVLGGLNRSSQHGQFRRS